jgi:hypothetical protein
LILLGQCQLVTAQSFWVGSQNDQLLRIMSLQDTSLEHSLMIRPMQVDSIRSSISILNGWVQSKRLLLKKSKSFLLNALPLDWVNQFNTHHPYGWNDGPMINAKGYQSLVRTGLGLKSKHLDVQIVPEYVYSANPQYEYFQNYGAKTLGTFSKVYLGQSRVTFNIGHVKLGFSTESIWWGPGISNSLIMSNNAPGFMHFTFGSKKPLSTKMGSFEWQLIGGKLSSSSTLLYEQNNNQGLEFGFSRERYINAYILVFAPKVIPNLSIGFIRSMQQLISVTRNSSKGVFDRFLPVLPSPFQKKNNQGEDTSNRDQLASLFFRMRFPSAKAELYAEYGYTDYKLNIRDYTLNTIHSSAYIVGFRKLQKIRKNIYSLLELEITAMNESPMLLVREAGPWYRHWQLADGYTNDNQVIGAGAGYGVNMMTLRYKLFSPIYRVEISYDNIKRRPEWNRPKWVDRSIGIGFCFNKIYGLQLSLQNNLVFSKNYAWEKQINRFNLFTRLGITYLW